MARNSQTQIQEQAQVQTLSPQQLLAVQLLEMTTVEIEDRVRSEVMDNPALEPVEHDGSDDNDAESVQDDALSVLVADKDDDYSGNEEIQVSQNNRYTADIPVGGTVSFGETLMEQLGELEMTPVEHAVGEYIIGSLDEDGLLRKPLDEICDELLIYGGMDVSMELILAVLARIQQFEPAGIAARDLRECLLLQLDRKSADRDVTLQRMILTGYYDDFAGKRWETLAEKIGATKEECREAIADIVRLNPRPGASLAESVGFSRQQIIPDFILDVFDDKIVVVLNNTNTPSLKVNDGYMQMLDEQMKGGNNEQKAAALFLKQKIDAAKGFISAVQQREQTMLSTMRAIAALQKDFFLSGGDEACLKPMILEDIAKLAGHDVSTISRVGNSKYVQVPWGIYQLKYFFSDGVVKEDGTEQSVYELFRVIREIVDNEDKGCPLTDQALQERLIALGYNVARRTVAKYREQLEIPVARLRKE